MFCYVGVRFFYTLYTFFLPVTIVWSVFLCQADFRVHFYARQDFYIYFKVIFNDSKQRYTLSGR